MTSRSAYSPSPNAAHPVVGLLRNSLTGRHEPFSLVHFVTERCNARCPHCFIDFKHPLDPSTELELSAIRLLTKQLGTALYNVNLTGGEPFLRDDLFEITRSYVENTPARSIVVTTNGSFTGKIREFVRQYSRLRTNCTLTISLSVDDREENHNQGRAISGLYQRVMESCRAVTDCSDRRIMADIALTVTQVNAARIAEVCGDLIDRGVPSIFPILMREEGVQRNGANREVIAEAYRKVCRLTDKYYTGKGSGPAPVLQRAKNRTMHGILCDLCHHPRHLSPCRAGSLFATIGADGRVAPCEILQQTMPLGNLKDYGMDFLKLWNDKPARAAREKIRSSRCHCTFECAWTVNILANPCWWPKLLLNVARELL